ncbi:hypothetical protein BGX27_002275 [Mortierella sp. AM989]|nr:hypothetical protein BGX27_002275 [Mortierella sp. AM989]
MSQEQCIQKIKVEADSKKLEQNETRDEFNLAFINIRKIFTLIFIHDIEHNQLLLGQKQRGALLGQWNGFGGKVERGLESIAESAARELEEEAFIKAPLFPIGFIQWVVFRSGDNDEDDNTIYPYRDIMVVFKAHSFEQVSSAESESESEPGVLTESRSTSMTEFLALSPSAEAHASFQPPVQAQASGRITEFKPSDEMAPAWWDINSLPWEYMRINHKVWYPFMLADRPYRGVYWYQTTRANVATDKDGAKKDNAQRENAQEVWVEDLKRRCFQFGTQPIGGKSSKSGDDGDTLNGYASQLGVSETCYSSTLSSAEQKNRQEANPQLKSEPTRNQYIDEEWLRTAIARAEHEWTLSS